MNDPWTFLDGVIVGFAIGLCVSVACIWYKVKIEHHRYVDKACMPNPVDTQ